MKISYALKGRLPYCINLNNEPEYCYNFDSIEVGENESKEKIEALIMERVPQEWELVTWKKSDHQ